MNRRELLQAGTVSALSALMPTMAEGEVVRDVRTVAQYEVFEVRMEGPAEGNPFAEVTLGASFTLGHRTVAVEGFYDGGTAYCIRFMPDTAGAWSYVTRSNRAALQGQRGGFVCGAARAGEHGPVRVAQTHHFAHADGTAFFPFGTTCYAWVHQGAPYEQMTLDTLKDGPFNKLRMCVFPKSYEYNHNEPQFYPFPRPAGTALTTPGDTTRFDPAFFRHLEERIGQLRELGIQADLILFHPYDRWGYASLSAETDARYVRYVVARLAAYSNIWWSLANEFDLMKAKTTGDFTRLLLLVAEVDPYQHLRSIHYSNVKYDYGSPAVTHASLQTYDFAAAAGWLAAWKKPICFDEIQYEGDLPRRWGNLSGEEMTRRFWLATVAGCYATHGETYLNHPDAEESEDDKIWWSNGGKLSGTSPARIGFLRKVLEGTTRVGLEAAAEPYYLNAKSLSGNDAKAAAAAILYYFDLHQPVQYEFPLPETASYRAELIDPWAMTVVELPGVHRGKARVKLPARPHLAVRFMRI